MQPGKFNVVVWQKLRLFLSWITTKCKSSLEIFQNIVNLLEWEKGVTVASQLSVCVFFLPDVPARESACAWEKKKLIYTEERYALVHTIFFICWCGFSVVDGIIVKSSSMYVRFMARVTFLPFCMFSPHSYFVHISAFLFIKYLYCFIVFLHSQIACIDHVRTHVHSHTQAHTYIHIIHAYNQYVYICLYLSFDLLLLLSILLLLLWIYYICAALSQAFPLPPLNWFLLVPYADLKKRSYRFA